MTQQTVNVGTSANDGTGDPIRTAMQKINSNFTELYSTPVFVGSTGYTGSASSVAGYAGSVGSRGYTGSTGSLGYSGSASTQAGYSGSVGARGYTGSGATGYTGSASTQAGYTGSLGTRGYSGSRGDGYSGSVGATGYTGSSGPGYTGSGSVGYTGSVGLTGFTGSIGTTGFSGSIGSSGFTGSSGTGYTGSAGLTGFTGSIGSTGFTGSVGAVGYSGSRGFTGSIGYSGSIGSSGYTGSASTVAGYSGSVGARGYTGSKNTLDTFRINVMDYGAVGDGVANDTLAFTSALAACPNGGTVIVPPGRYKIEPITVPAYKQLSGSCLGPFDGIYDPATVTNVPTILLSNTASPGVTLTGMQSSVSDLMFYYTNQAALSSASPTVFPATVYAGDPIYGSGGHFIRRCTFVNSYHAVSFMSSGRSGIYDCNIGAFWRGITIDRALDTIWVSGNHHSIFWDIYTNTSPASNLTKWSQTNGVALHVYRCDNLLLNGMFAIFLYAGIVFDDCPVGNYIAPYYNGYGNLSNIDFDCVSYGIIAISTNRTAGGIRITNMNVGANFQSYGIAAQTPLFLSNGGTEAPIVTWTNGAIRGTWVSYFPAIQTGEASVSQVYGINTVGQITPPAVPASGISPSDPGVKNPYGVPFRIGFAGSVTGITINDGGLGLVGDSGMFILAPNETVKIQHPGTISWAWFTL